MNVYIENNLGKCLVSPTLLRNLLFYCVNAEINRKFKMNIREPVIC